MLLTKLKHLLQIFNVYPFGFSRTINYPRPHLGIPGVNEETEIEASMAVERVAISEARMSLNVADRDLSDIEADVVTLREARDTFLRCLLCTKYMKTPLFVDRCEHRFCQSCLVQYLNEQREQSVSPRHRCPAESCDQLILRKPRPIPMVSALAGAIHFATYDTTQRSEWCSDEAPTFDGLFS